MMPKGKRPVPPSGGGEFTQAMRFELLGEDERPLLTSYGASFALGAMWLALVYLVPRPPVVGPWEGITAEPKRGVFNVVEWPPDEPSRVVKGTPLTKPVFEGRGGGTRNTGSPGEAIRNAFQNGGARAIGAARQLGAALAGASSTAGTAGDVLRNVTGGDGGKVAIAGAGLGAARGVGKSGAFAGDSGASGSVGAVAGGRSGVGHTATVVAEPVVVTRPEIASSRDVADVGQVVRSYSAQLQSCYEREGLRQNPSLAGTLTAAITISGAGRVTDVDITRRTWSGAGAEDAERCIASTIRRWRFAAASEAEGTYSFPFSFTAK